jgi:hypothetical protein
VVSRGEHVRLLKLSTAGAVVVALSSRTEGQELAVVVMGVYLYLISLSFLVLYGIFFCFTS